MKELNDYLFQVVQNARKCNHCALRHDDGICFFAYECIKCDFYYYKEEDDCTYIIDEIKMDAELG